MARGASLCGWLSVITSCSLFSVDYSTTVFIITAFYQSDEVLTVLLTEKLGQKSIDLARLNCFQKIIDKYKTYYIKNDEHLISE